MSAGCVGRGGSDDNGGRSSLWPRPRDGFHPTNGGEPFYCVLGVTRSVNPCLKEQVQGGAGAGVGSEREQERVPERSGSTSSASADPEAKKLSGIRVNKFRMRLERVELKWTPTLGDHVQRMHPGDEKKLPVRRNEHFQRPKRHCGGWFHMGIPKPDRHGTTSPPVFAECPKGRPCRRAPRANSKEHSA